MVRQTKAQILQAIEDTRIQREAIQVSLSVMRWIQRCVGHGLKGQFQDRQELHTALQRLGIPANPPNISLFREVQFPGKGLGIQASIDIPRGTPLLTEEALFSKRGGAVPQIWAQHAAFLTLFCPVSPTSPATPEKRFNANNFSMNGTERGIFLKASRFNHSCIPNAYFAWNPRSRRITINAIVDIRTNDEICLNYIPTFFSRPRSERHRKLRHYDFTCQCPACLPDSEFGSASAERRKRMHILEPKLDRNETASKQRLLDINHFDFLFKREGLVYLHLANLYHLKASWYRMKMNDPTTARQPNLEFRRFCRDSALEAARKELDLDITANGHDSPVVDRTVEFIREIGRE